MSDKGWFRISPGQKWHYAVGEWWAICSIGHCGEVGWCEEPPIVDRCKTCIRLTSEVARGM